MSNIIAKSINFIFKLYLFLTTVAILEHSNKKQGLKICC